MADNRVEEAVNVVARRILADSACNVEWGDYPEIGMSDWDLVIARLDEIASKPPSPIEYEAAYDFLAARADSQDAP
ncbi:MAG TPA: hypothetical protein VIL68_02540 [Propionibacteriaceae bacterium]